MAALLTKSKPKSIQKPSVYLTRTVFRFTDPTGFSADQWRLIAREPINKMAQRFIVRELSSLPYQIVSDERNDPRVDEYTERWSEIWEDGAGFTVWLARTIDDACTLPFGAASECGWKGDDLVWVLHVDAATLLPTYERKLPYVQVNPDDWTQRVYFNRRQLQRLRVNPRSDIRFKEYQISPTEDSFLPIEALSKIYLYYMQELTDTPPLGLLDVMDMTEGEATDWAASFREMLEGIDLIKIPMLYDHEKPAKWIPFGRTPQDLNVVEQFKRFAEMLLGEYGLSIGDLRLFEHESTKAGERVSQLVTERSGIGFWATLIADFINRLLPPGLKFQFKQPRPERELVVASRQAAQLAMLQAAAGGKAIITKEDALEQAVAWEIFDVEVEVPEEEALPIPAGQLPPQLPGGVPEEQRDAETDEDLSKAWLDVGAMVEKDLGVWRDPKPATEEQLAESLRLAFQDVGRAVDAEQVGEIVEAVRQRVETLEAMPEGIAEESNA